MDVPQFPAPPPRNVGLPSRKNSSHARPVSYSFAPRKRHASRERKRPGSSYGGRRPPCRNTVYPRLAREKGKCIRQRVTELRFKMTEQKDQEERECAPPDEQRVPRATDTPMAVSEGLSTHLNDEINHNHRAPGITSTGVQTPHGIQYRLRVLPSLKDVVNEKENPKKSSKFFKHVRFLGRLSLSQFGLVWLLVLWAMIGAASFYATEGPREKYQVVELRNMQKELAVSLAMELRQLKAKDEEVEPLWSNKVRQYVMKHEKLILMAVNSGYGEGGEGGQLWTFPGCILFSISLLTTLGFGAPVPRTNAGRTVTVIFAAIGIPAHFLLIMNFGLMVAVRLQKYAIYQKFKNRDIDLNNSILPMPKWVKIMPFFCIALYYILGILCFGFIRRRPFAASILFPLDFTAAGGLATTSGHVRILYGIYLEGAVALASVAVAVLRVSATQSLTNIGFKYGLLTYA